MFTVIRSFESSIARQSTFENGKNTSLRSSKHRTKTESPKLYLDRQSLNKANDQMRVASFLHCVCKMYTNVYYCGVCVLLLCSPNRGSEISEMNLHLPHQPEKCSSGNDIIFMISG